MEVFSNNGVGTLLFIDGTMDKYQYINILANNIPTSSTKRMLNDFIFQLDNDPNHASYYAKDYIREKKSKYWNDHLNCLIQIAHI